MPIEITRMTPADFDGAIECIQQGFDADPYNNWIYPDKSKFSPARNRASLRLRCTWGLKHALFYVARDPSSATPHRILGTSMWLPPVPPSAPQTWSLYLSTWTLWFQQGIMNLFYGRGGLIPRRYYIWKARQAEAQAATWTQDKGYYFCNIVVVRPGEQGRGVGRALIDVVLRRADRESVWCYLESSRREPNVAIYEKMGFELVREMGCVDVAGVEGDGDGDGVRLFCMMRRPRDVDGEGKMADDGAS